MIIKPRLLASVFGALCLLSPLAKAAPAALEAPSSEKLEEARALIAAMRVNVRGPYSNIQWVCKDGTVLPPKSGACIPHGGGNQYAKYSPMRDRLAALGYPVGTIYTALDRPAQAPDTRPFLRLRDLPFEQYMTDVDDGWVLHKARGYRGRVQIEDEEQAGRALLLSILADPARTQSDLLLVRELAKTVPHAGAGQDPTREIRRLSLELAEKNPRFEPLRAEIHGKPSRASIARVENWRANNTFPASQNATFDALIGGLKSLYGETGSQDRLTQLAKTLQRADPTLAQKLATPKGDRLTHAADSISEVRAKFDTTKTYELALIYLDALTLLEAEIITAARSLPAPENRRAGLNRAAILVRAAADLGWLSPTEKDRLVAPISKAVAPAEAGEPDADPITYSDMVKRLQLAPAWAQGHVQYTFAEPLAKYTPLDTRATKFIDDLLRGSIIQPLSEMADRLARDEVALSGVQARLMGPLTPAIALNPGQATGRLRVLEPNNNGELPAYTPADIIVIPNTTAELFPAAGIITVGEGNPLSHIQILARNLGIPNIIIDSGVKDRLKAFDGQFVDLAAAADGRILMVPAPALPENTAKPAAPSQISKSGTIPAPIPDLTKRDPIPLSGLRASLSGVVVGPKAANVGELAFLFPDRVAPAVALPFGAFAAHTATGQTGPRIKLKKAFAAFARDEMSEDQFLTLLDEVRAETAKLVLQPETRAKLETALDTTLAPGAGLFVRSDTNMEDLPQFTGAGLNLTVANVTGREKQYAAISQVWASVYTRRAMAWRSQILSNPDDVFSSVLLMQSVPSEKSGVMVTTDLTGANKAEALTVSVAWGVGGAVDNESAASYLLLPDADLLLSEAKAPYQRYLKSDGGVGWKPAPSGPVLSQTEAAELRVLAAEVIARYPQSLDEAGEPLPFDIEFGFAEGKLNLLQIRPLVQRGALAAEAIVSRVIPKPTRRQGVRLDDRLQNQSSDAAVGLSKD